MKSPLKRKSGESSAVSSNEAIIRSDGSETYDYLQHFTWRNPFLLAFVAIIIAFGLYTLLTTSADTLNGSKVWSTASQWEGGNLSNTVVAANSVVLNSKVTTITTNTPGTSTTDLALNRPAYGSTTSTGHPSNADDGNTSTSWTPDAFSREWSNQWLFIDLGNNTKVGEIKATWANSKATAYTIQYSNDADHWTTVYSTNNGKGGVEDVTHLHIRARYIRVDITKMAAHSLASLSELAAYGPGTSTNNSKTTTSFYNSGTISLSYAASNTANWSSLSGETVTLSNTSISYQVRTSNDDSSWSGWSTVPSNGSLSSISASKYIQVEVTLNTSNTSVTPTLNQLVLNYTLPIASPTASLKVSSDNITAGQSDTLSWSSTNATSCSASGAWTGAESTSGSITVTPTATSTYDLSCSGASSTATATPMTITVTPATTTTSSNTSGCVNGSTVSPCIGSPTTGASDWGTPIFDDEFTKDNNSLNSKWSTGWWNTTEASGPVNSAENDCYTPSQVSVGSTNGLDLNFKQQSETCGPNGSPETEPYNGSIVTTDPYGVNGAGFQYTYGFAEALIYIPPSGSQVANWPGFWTTSDAGATYGEQDIVEGLGGQACYHYHTSAAAPGGCASGNYTGWHTFGADWQSGSVTYYYDGKDVGTITNSGITDTPEYLIIDNADGLDGGPVLAPSDMLVKYVRVWQQ